jgi:hypothetical protein
MESLADAVGVLENAPDFDLFPEGWNDVSTVSEAAATSPTPVTPPAKKRRLSLSLKKGGGRGGPLTEISNQRFVSPVKEKEFNAAAKGVVPSNTKQCNRWACRVYESWAKQRNEREGCTEKVPENLLVSDNRELICKFMPQVCLHSVE